VDGVTIGKGCVVGAGSVVTKNLPPYSVAVGVPARAVKNRLDADTVRKQVAGQIHYGALEEMRS
jgi:acetyltransferase-like isoleucine patch superfamily enzyme